MAYSRVVAEILRSNDLDNTPKEMSYDELAQEMCKREDSLDHLTAKAEMARRAALQAQWNGAVLRLPQHAESAALRLGGVMEFLEAPVQVWHVLVIVIMFTITFHNLQKQMNAIGGLVVKIWDRMNPQDHDEM
jgi:hypothetical protein